jgi:hypothetical protein
MPFSTRYETKGLSEANGYAPHLLPTSTLDCCGICWKDLACEASGAHSQPLSKAEHTILDLCLQSPSNIQYTDILRLKKDQQNTTIHHHHDEEETGLRTKACGHIFGAECIKE